MEVQLGAASPDGRCVWTPEPLLLVSSEVGWAVMRRTDLCRGNRCVFYTWETTTMKTAFKKGMSLLKSHVLVTSFKDSI